ncbi:MAG: hypothetical protein ACI4SC_03035 [Candidatus Neoclostridium sp.]
MSDPKNKSLLKRTAVMAVVLLVLIVVFGINVVIYFNRSFGWFSRSLNANAKGMEVSLAGYGITDVYFRKGVGESDYTEITSWDSVFSGLSPGDSVSIKAQYSNDSGTAHTLGVYFGIGDGNEIPLVKDGKYYYFGTQLKITEIVIDGNEQSFTGDKFLMTPPSDKLAYDAQQTAENAFIADVSVPSGGSAAVEITVQFVNYPDVNQNVYQGFGKGSETCFRQLIAYVND